MRHLLVVLLLAVSCAHADALVDDMDDSVTYASLEIQRAIHEDHSGFGNHVLAEMTAGSEFGHWLGIEGRLQGDARDAAMLLLFQGGRNTASAPATDVRFNGALNEFSGLTFNAGVYLRASAHLGDAFSLYAIGGAGYAIFRIRRCAPSPGGDICDDAYEKGVLGGYGLGARVRLQAVWLGAEMRRQAGDGLRMNVYGINAGYAF